MRIHTSYYQCYFTHSKANQVIRNLHYTHLAHSTFSPVMSISPPSPPPPPSYTARLLEFSHLNGLDSPVYGLFPKEKEGLFAATATVKGVSFTAPGCTSPAEAYERAAKAALEFFVTGAGGAPASGRTLPPPPLPLPPTGTSTSQGIPDVYSYKNKLQEYTSKTFLQMPIYHTIQEGPPHAPKFRCTFTVQSADYTSQTFTQRKCAEQDAARVALESLHKRPMDEISPTVNEDTAFCKCILNEYATKMHLDKPSYLTIQEEGVPPIFLSTLHFQGVQYTGVRGKNKKEAEQLAARYVIQIILDKGDSQSVQVMCGIIQSKFKVYSAVTKTKDTDSIFSAANDIVNKQEASMPLHLSKKPRLEFPTPGIAFVAGSVQILSAPASGTQRKTEGKKKAKGNRQADHEKGLLVMAQTEDTPVTPSAAP